MKGTTHLAAGLAAAGILYQQQPDIVFALCLTAGSILPDIDKHTSMVGRRVPVIPLLLKHRGITHSLLVAAALFVIYKPLGLGAALHLLLDMFNPEGIPLLWPLPKNFRIPVIHHLCPSGGIVDSILGAALWVAVAFLAACIVTGTAPIPFIKQFF